MGTWAKAPTPRHQLVLISQTADDLVADDHPVRLLAAFLDEMDWRAWEAKYDRRRGQPPIHPKLMAGAILYGLVRRIRSSRDLEEATRERLDYIWFLAGRTIDHSTFAAFRTEFQEQLKGLNRQISRAIVARAKPALVELIMDGTRLRANSDRHGARTAAALEKLVAACAEQLDRKLEELGREDEDGPQALRQQIAELEAQCDKYRTALDRAGERDATKQEISGEKATPVRVPVTDPDASIQPNKEGGFAPNYTPTATVESTSGAIVSADVVAGNNECDAIETTVRDSEETLGRKPDRLLADGGFAKGAHLEELEADGIETYMPVGTDFRDANPANRADPTQPVAREHWDRLPRTGKKIDKRAFLYDPERNLYYCPMGQMLREHRRGRYKRTGIAYRAYVCPGKDGCPLADQCVKAKAARRQISRDQYQDIRDRVGRRMASKAGQAVYRKRAPSIEGVFGVVKQSMGIRQFLLRGLRKVRHEWQWICGAYNMRKMLSLLAANPSGANPMETGA